MLKFAEKSHNFRMACHLAKFIQGASDKKQYSLGGGVKVRQENLESETFAEIHEHFVLVHVNIYEFHLATLITAFVYKLACEF